MGACASSARRLPPANVPTAFEQLSSHGSTTPPPGIQQGSLVLLGTAEYTVQYMTSKGTLDLKSAATGDVLYGIGRDEVTAVSPEGPNGATAASPTASAPTEAAVAMPTGHVPITTAAAVPSGPELELVGEPLAKPGGSGARVHRCRLEGHGQVPLAVKLLPTSARPDQLAVLAAEVELCRRLRDTSIVKFVHLSTSLGVGGVSHCAIVMELLPVSLHGPVVARARPHTHTHPHDSSHHTWQVSLEGLVEVRASQRTREPFDATRLMAITHGIAAGLDYLHARCSPPVLHRDVKPGNVPDPDPNSKSKPAPKPA